MEASRQPADGKKWLDWLLWWKVDPDELRLQVEGYNTLRSVFAVRRLGCLLAAVFAAQAAYFAALTFAPGTASLFPVACFQAAVALGVAVLGGFLLRGNRVAIIGLMLLCTIQPVFVSVWASDASFLLLSLVGWAVMRVFYLALCVKRSRKGAA